MWRKGRRYSRRKDWYWDSAIIQAERNTLCKGNYQPSQMPEIGEKLRAQEYPLPLVSRRGGSLELRGGCQIATRQRVKLEARRK